MQALHFAARSGFASTCELLVRSGAALESGAAKNQATPLLLAVEGITHFFPIDPDRRQKCEPCSLLSTAGHAGAASVLLQVINTTLTWFGLMPLCDLPLTYVVAWREHQGYICWICVWNRTNCHLCRMRRSSLKLEKSGYVRLDLE
jgi:hypothetical protein